MTTTKEIFREYLKRKGLKITPERNAVLETIFSFHKHFNVDELYDLLRKQNKSISHASIYRTLPLLIESGLVSESLRCQGRVSYEHIFGHDHHDHLICIKCGRIIEFKDNRIEKLQKEVCKKYKFEPSEHKLGIRGYCNKCR
ncbi:MAG: transcriptional repressor [Elusimicrobia bacterium CG1_02_37_114]|nr:MAG: transcriptional repressor [Elusimicrobia bacterium CG1_02_37_114]PIV53412.1 MAG: transcriptional repressor [Elusimicrobia bacterium CG02_land_8_20_14_3_00_37_13]PIZ13755.1 MAG: transcriptional repressor [Elusimicrobia bacterium CG_4_10_14_0_8_um_filter_37_32]